jgi:hypothetical protein
MTIAPSRATAAGYPWLFALSMAIVDSRENPWMLGSIAIPMAAGRPAELEENFPPAFKQWTIKSLR